MSEKLSLGYAERCAPKAASFSARHWRAIVLGAAVVLAVVIASGWWFNFQRDPFRGKSFSTAAWAATSREGRAPMCRDLIRNHLPTGLPVASVRSLLGSEYDTITAEDDGGHAMAGAQTMSYSLGNWSGYGYDDAFLYVHLDTTGRVTSAEVTGY